MSYPLALLDEMPSPSDFYGIYWNKRPFVVRQAIPDDVFAGLIAGDELAGLSMEDGPLSRLVKTAGPESAWSCRFGPFSESDLQAVGDADWSLLVQNVEQFHPGTAALLPWFTFAPRWMMDDVMVSYSAPGGSVGPHLDSYHVFLVQGQGRRRWRLGNAPIDDEIYVDTAELKLLATAFAGDEIEVGCGDVLYVPPKFAHEGTTLEAALTFSVGFLGPKLSDLYSAFGHYLSTHEGLDRRFVGSQLATDSAGFSIGANAIAEISAQFNAATGSPDFVTWLVAFFTEPGHEDLGNWEPRELSVTSAQFKADLIGGARLVKPPHIKFAVANGGKDKFYLGVGGTGFDFGKRQLPTVQKLMAEQQVGLVDEPDLVQDAACCNLLLALYNHQALEFVAADDD
ncbi:MAG: cupin domain-containing protein [Rhodospirillales bacterium]|nr:cupin domain-containing protein [Rhodospirillales bacterium]